MEKQPKMSLEIAKTIYSVKIIKPNMKKVLEKTVLFSYEKKYIIY
jgi:hypothetical protein